MKHYSECLMFYRYCIIFVFYYYGNMKKVFLEPQYFSFHGEKSSIRHSYIFFVLV